MKKLILILSLFISLGASAQTLNSLPAGSKPYGNQLYITPDGLIIAGTTTIKYRVIGTKSYLDSLSAIYDSRYVKKSGDTITGPIVIQGNNLTADNLYTSGGFAAGTYGGGITRLNTPSAFEILLNNDPSTGVRITSDNILTRNVDGKKAMFQSDALDFSGGTINGDLNANGNIFSSANGNIFRYQHRSDGLLIGGYIGGENFDALHITNDGTPHFKSLIPPTQIDDIARLGDLNSSLTGYLPLTGGTVNGGFQVTNTDKGNLRVDNSLVALRYGDYPTSSTAQVQASAESDGTALISLFTGTASDSPTGNGTQRGISFHAEGDGGINIVDAVSNRGLTSGTLFTPVDDFDYLQRGNSDLRYLKLTGGTVTGIVNITEPGGYNSTLDAGVLAVKKDNNQVNLEPEGLRILNLGSSSVMLRKSNTAGEIDVQLPSENGKIALESPSGNGYVQISPGTDQPGNISITGEITAGLNVISASNFNLNGNGTIGGNLNLKNDLIVDNDKFFKGKKSDGTVGYTMGISSDNNIYFGDIINNINTSVRIVGNSQSIVLDSTGMVLNSDNIRLPALPNLESDTYRVLTYSDGKINSVSHDFFAALQTSGTPTPQVGNLSITGILTAGNGLLLGNDVFYKSKNSAGNEVYVTGLSASDNLYFGDIFSSSNTNETLFYGSGSLRMKFPNAGGITISAPVQSDSDIEVTDLAKGVILKSPDGTRWRISVSDAGVLTTTSL